MLPTVSTFPGASCGLSFRRNSPLELFAQLVSRLGFLHVSAERVGEEHPLSSGFCREKPPTAEPGSCWALPDTTSTSEAFSNHRELVRRSLVTLLDCLLVVPQNAGVFPGSLIIVLLGSEKQKRSFTPQFHVGCCVGDVLFLTRHRHHKVILFLVLYCASRQS